MTSELRDNLVLRDLESGVLTLTLNRPHRRNAWTLPMQSRYFDLLAEADADADVRAIVVTGAGGSFCPGFDIAQLHTAVSGATASTKVTSGRPMNTPLMTRKPVIAAVEGACAGVGLLMALMTDVRFIASGARLSTAYTRRAIAPEYGAAWIVSRLTRWDVANDLLMSARKVTGAEAVQIGLGTHLTDDGAALQAATDYARDLVLHCSPTAMFTVKQLLRRDLERTYAEGWTESLIATKQLLLHPDAKEGVTSYIERRRPLFASLSPDFELVGVSDDLEGGGT